MYHFSPPGKTPWLYLGGVVWSHSGQSGAHIIGHKSKEGKGKKPFCETSRGSSLAQTSAPTSIRYRRVTCNYSCAIQWSRQYSHWLILYSWLHSYFGFFWSLCSLAFINLWLLLLFQVLSQVRRVSWANSPNLPRREDSKFAGAALVSEVVFL